MVMTLIEYLQKTKLTYREFAVLVGVDASQIHRWATGRRLPPLAQVAKIRDATGGVVSADDFLPPQEDAA